MNGKDLLAAYAAAHPERVVWSAERGWHDTVDVPRGSFRVAFRKEWIVESDDQVRDVLGSFDTVDDAMALIAVRSDVRLRLRHLGDGPGRFVSSEEAFEW